MLIAITGNVYRRTEKIKPDNTINNMLSILFGIGPIELNKRANATKNPITTR